MDPLQGLKQYFTNIYNAKAEAAWRALGRNKNTPGWNAFAHTYVGALARLEFGPYITRIMGESRESGTWPKYSKTLGDRRDTYKDLYNNAIGIKAMGYLLENNKDIGSLAVYIANLVDRGVTINATTDPRVLRSITDKKPNPNQAQADLQALKQGAWSAASGQNVDPSISLPNTPPVDPLLQGYFLNASYDPDEGIGFGDGSGAADPGGDNYLNQNPAVTDQQAQRFLDAVNFLIQSNRVNEFGNLGNLVGSSLSRLIGGGPIVDTAASALLGTVMQNFAQGIAAGGFNRPIINQAGNLVDGVLDDFGQEFMANLQSAAIGTVSSLISLEIGNALGVNGFGGELLNTVNASIIGQVASNVANGQNLFAGLNSEGLFHGIEGVTPEGGILPGAIGSFFGAKLGSLILAPINTEGAILSSIGASAGVWALTSGAGALGIGSVATSLGNIFGSLANIGVPFVGSLVGFLLGSLIGRLFGRKKPRTPSASAETYLDLSSVNWTLGAVTSANGGNRALVTDMATSASDGINQLVSIAAGNTGTVLVANTSSPHQKYGHVGSTLYFDEQISGYWTRRYSGSDADRAVEMGVIAGLHATFVAGGDLIAKRAIYGTNVTDISTLLGNLAVARDVQTYLKNTEAINRLITYQPNDPFSLTWMSTLLRADELNLLRYQASDFFGGMRGFLSSFGFGSAGVGASLGFENVNLGFEGAALRIATQDGSGPFGLLAGTNNITDPNLAKQSVFIDNFAVTTSYTNWNGQATAGNDIWIGSQAGGPLYMNDSGVQYYGYWDPYYGYYQYPVYVSGGDDIFVGSNFNDTLYGQSGWDWLDGGAGDDLIDGGANEDVLLGRVGSDRMLGGDGNDYIAGGDGDDYFFDSARTWGLYGGAGNDTLVGGAGTDSSYGESGDDLFIVDQDGGWGWDALTGQDGSDTVSYERFTSGAYIDFSVLGGWSWDPTAKYIYGDAISGIENVTGTRFADQLLGDSGGNVLKGLDGDDYLYGRDGDDVLDGGAGQDLLDGGNGFDLVELSSAQSGSFVDLTSGTSLSDEVTDTLSSIEGVRGSAFDDVIVGSAGYNQLYGGAGDDLFGFTAGEDYIDGGNGFDTLDFSAATTGGATVYYDGGYYDPYYGYYPGAGWIASVGGVGSATFASLEGFVGTDFGDYMAGDVGDELFQGGAGNDQLYGGGGSDQYVFGRGDGQDSVGDTSDGSNSIELGREINWRDVAISGANYAQQGGNLVVSLRGTADQIVVGYNFSYINSGTNAGVHNHVIKSLDLGGLSRLDIDAIDWTPYAADDSSTVVYGAQNRADLIFAYAGDDTIYTAGNSYNYETRGNVVYAGDGYDTIYGSYGDDQYVFERGNARDVLIDQGGGDTIVMGPSVAAEDVIYEVVNTYGTSGDYGSSADLYVGIRDPNNPNQSASQVADHIRIVGGGTKYVGAIYGTEILNTVEYVRVGGQEIDLTKASIDWTVSYYYDGGSYYPIALDLDGDGIELRSVEGSRIATVESDGVVTRMGWLGQDDGFLALDRDGNGAIDRIGEISFVSDKAGAKTDLEGLAAYDSNGDGRLDASDARWADFKVWQDRDQDGYGAGAELVSLDDAGIASISLEGQLTGFTSADGPDNTVLASSDIIWSDPARTGSAYDVALARLQVRTDGGSGGGTDPELAARGFAADWIEAKLRGIQTLTSEQAEAIRRSKAEAIDDGQGGRFYRVEDLLSSGADKTSDGLMTIDPEAARSNLEAGRSGGHGNFGDSAWTQASSTDPGSADMRGADAVYHGPELSDAQKAAVSDARVFAAQQKAENEAKAAARAAKDAADSVVRSAPTPPTDAEIRQLKMKDRFALLDDMASPEPGDGDAQRPLAALRGDPMPVHMVLGDDAPNPLGGALREARQAGRMPGLYSSSLDRRLPETNVETGTADADYGVVIRAANARLIQALASIGDAPVMIASYQGLNVAEDSQNAWMSVAAMPSVQRMAAL